MFILKPTFLFMIIVLFSIGISSESSSTEEEDESRESNLECGIVGCAPGYIFISEQCTCISLDKMIEMKENLKK